MLACRGKLTTEKCIFYGNLIQLTCIKLLYRIYSPVVNISRHLYIFNTYTFIFICCSPSTANVFFASVDSHHHSDNPARIILGSREGDFLPRWSISGSREVLCLLRKTGGLSQLLQSGYTGKFLESLKGEILQRLKWGCKNCLLLHRYWVLHRYFAGSSRWPLQ